MRLIRERTKIEILENWRPGILIGKKIEKFNLIDPICATCFLLLMSMSCRAGCVEMIGGTSARVDKFFLVIGFFLDFKMLCKS